MMAANYFYCTILLCSVGSRWERDGIGHWPIQISRLISLYTERTEVCRISRECNW